MFSRLLDPLLHGDDLLRSARLLPRLSARPVHQHEPDFALSPAYHLSSQVRFDWKWL